MNGQHRLLYLRSEFLNAPFLSRPSFRSKANLLLNYEIAKGAFARELPLVSTVVDAVTKWRMTTSRSVTFWNLLRELLTCASFLEVFPPIVVASSTKFSLRLRFTTHTILCIMRHLLPKDASDNRGHPLPRLLKQLLTLRFYGADAFQTVIGDVVKISQSATCNPIWTVTRPIASVLCPKYIILPSTSEAASVMTRFYAVAGFQAVKFCIDSTHVQTISRGGNDAEVYRRRKGVFSINDQARYSFVSCCTFWIATESITSHTGPELQFLTSLQAGLDKCPTVEYLIIAEHASFMKKGMPLWYCLEANDTRACHF